MEEVNYENMGVKGGLATLWTAPPEACNFKCESNQIRVQFWFQIVQSDSKMPYII